MTRLSAVWRDLIHAARSLAKARAFAFVCVLSLGIGLTPAIAIQYWARTFTMPPPGLNTDGLVELVTVRAGPRGPTDDWSYPDYIDLGDAAGFPLVGWAAGQNKITVPASGETARWRTLFVSAGYFPTIGVELARGPGFTEPTSTADPVVILGHAFWQKHVGGDPDIVGKALPVDGVSHTVVGIAPEHFTGHLIFNETALFLPLERHPRVLANDGLRFDRSTEWVRIHGRLGPGVSIEQASAAVSAVTARLAREYPASNENRSGVVRAYHAMGTIEGEDLPVVMALWQMMTLMPLLVVCLNIAGMMQVRSAMRERELSIRQAIGASRGRLIQYLLAEAVVLAALGGALASILLFSLPPLMSWWVGEPIPVEMQRALEVDFTRLAITGGLCLATSLVFGWLPASRFSRPMIMSVLKDEAGSGGVRAGRFQRVTAALQVAIAVPLLILAGLSLDRVRQTATAELGFAAEFVYAGPLTLDGVEADRDGFRVRGVLDNLAKTTGVTSVTVADGLPLDFRYRIKRVALTTDENTAPKFVSAHVTRVGAGYLDAMGIQLLRGRAFTTEDGAGAALVTVISKALADELGIADPIGRQLTLGTATDRDRPPLTLTIVGIAADFPTSQMSTERTQLLLPLAQHPDVRRDSVQISDDREGAPAMMLIARAAPGESPQMVTAALENAIREFDPKFERASIVTGVELREQSMADFLNAAAFTGMSGSVILLLAALGIYGVVGLMVATRRREIAVRLALGASRPRVIGMILFDVIRLVAPGVGVGLLITVALARLDGGVLVSSTEPLAYIVGAAIAVLTAVVSSLAPARRAASVQPMVAMRSE